MEAEKALAKVNAELEKQIDQLKNYVFECVGLPRKISLDLGNIALEQYVAETYKNYAGFKEACVILKENGETSIDDHGNGTHYYDIIVAGLKGEDTPDLESPYYVCYSGASSSGDHGYEVFNNTSEFVLEFDVDKYKLS